MIFNSTTIDGCILIEVEPIFDNRGSFTRTYCEKEFRRQNLNTLWVQQNRSFNSLSGTFRGMHFQSEAAPEIKLVHCSQGSILDIVVDLRRQSKTYLNVFSQELNPRDLKYLYIPSGVAHGFQTLEDNTIVNYSHSTPYSSGHSKGIRWNDPKVRFNIPLPISNISEQDENWPDYEDSTRSAYEL